MNRGVVSMTLAERCELCCSQRQISAFLHVSTSPLSICAVLVFLGTSADLGAQSLDWDITRGPYAVEQCPYDVTYRSPYDDVFSWPARCIPGFVAEHQTVRLPADFTQLAT
jgi:hypothetical protein